MQSDLRRREKQCVAISKRSERKTTVFRNGSTKKNRRMKTKASRTQTRRRKRSSPRHSLTSNPGSVELRRQGRNTSDAKQRVLQSVTIAEISDTMRQTALDETVRPRDATEHLIKDKLPACCVVEIIWRETAHSWKSRSVQFRTRRKRRKQIGSQPHRVPRHLVTRKMPSRRTAQRSSARRRVLLFEY